MAFNINEFKATTQNKRYFVKSNKFLARIPLPRGFIGTNEFTEVNRELEMWCETASLPGAALITHDVLRYGYGMKERRPTTGLVQDLNFNFYSDAGNGQTPNDYTNFKFLASWVRMAANYVNPKGIMNDGQSNWGPQDVYELSYKYEYVSDIDITVFRDDGTESHHIVLRDAFPTYVQEARLSWGDNGGVMIIPVLMTFTDWRFEPGE